MKFRYPFESRLALVDLIGIALFLMVGLSSITVRIFPELTLPIFVPMLTQRDWLDAGRGADKSGVESIALIQRPRLEYHIGTYGADTYISQNITRGEDAQDALNLWQNATANADGTPVSLGAPVSLTLPSDSQPNYLLTCRPRLQIGSTCVYYGQAGRWYIITFFVSEDSPFPSDELERLIPLINERLLQKAGQG